MVGWIDIESLGFACPDFADVFVRRKALQRLQSACAIVGYNEVGNVRFKLRMGIVVIPFYRRFLDRPVHPLNLPVGPGVVHLGKALVDFIRSAYTTEDLFEGEPLLLAVGELDAVARREQAVFLVMATRLALK